MITLTQYFGPHIDHSDATAEKRENALAMLDRVNGLLEIAYSEGVELLTNPATQSRISGSGNGGFRTQLSSVGAKSSKHKIGRAVDVYDPRRELAKWCVNNLDMLERFGLYMEDPRWTPTWVHLQDMPPGSGKVVYVPSTQPALAAALPGQSVT